MFLLGIDIGTSYWKAVLYNASGRVIAESVLPAKVHHGKKFDYYEPQQLWQSVALLIKEVTSQVKNPEAIKGIAVASMAESGVPLDGKGKAIHPIIAWYDNCTIAQSEWWDKSIGRKQIQAITGLRNKHIYSVHKMMWLRENKPEVFRRMAKWLCIPDFIVYKLTGEYSMDYSIASRTMLLDIRKRKWSDKMLGQAGLDGDVMPALHPAGTAVGKVSRKAAEETGLSRKTVVVTGGHDHVCGAFAAGAVDEGVILDSIGTAESLFSVVKKPVLTGPVYRAGFSSGCHVVPGKYYLMGGIYTSGAVIDWVTGLFTAGKNLSKKKKMGLYKKAIEEASDLSLSDKKLFMLPHFRGSGPPNVDYSRRGLIYGLNLSHTKHDLVDAAVRGLSCESRKMIEALEGCIGGRAGRYTVIGSLSGIMPWMQMKADILGRDLEVVKVPEAGTLGAAMLAGIGAGVYKSAVEPGKRIKLRTMIIKPESSVQNTVKGYYKTYLDLSEKS